MERLREIASARRQMAKKLLRIAAVSLICIAVGIALHQIIAYGGWEWNDMLSLFHHESTAWVTALAGVILGLLSFKA